MPKKHKARAKAVTPSAKTPPQKPPEARVLVPKYKPHPFAEMLPVMSEEQFNNLKMSILANGLLEKIVVYQGKVLDGRNRQQACLELGIAPKYRPFGDDKNEQAAVEFVISRNLQHRDLNKSQRAVVALGIVKKIKDHIATERAIKISRAVKELRISAKVHSSYLPAVKGKAKKKPGKVPPLNKATWYAARLVGVSDRYVILAKKLQDEGRTELLDAVFKNKCTLPAAIQKAKPAQQVGKPDPTRRLIEYLKKFIAETKPADSIKRELEATLSALQKEMAAAAKPPIFDDTDKPPKDSAAAPTGTEAQKAHERRKVLEAVTVKDPSPPATAKAKSAPVEAKK